jgi:hypothetical protein
VTTCLEDIDWKRCLRRGVDADFLPLLIESLKFHETVNLRKNGIVFPKSYVVAG